MRGRISIASLLATNLSSSSTDDVTKGKLVPPATSRYHQIRRYFLGTHTPNMPDHDFPIPEYLLNVAGYIYPNTLSKYPGIRKSWSDIFGVCVPRKYRWIWWYLDAAGGPNLPLVVSLFDSMQDEELNIEASSRLLISYKNVMCNVRLHVVS